VLDHPAFQTGALVIAAVPHSEPFRHDQCGLAACVHAAEPARVVEWLPPLLFADLAVLKDPRWLMATRTQITIAEDDDHAFFLAVAHLLSFIFF